MPRKINAKRIAILALCIMSLLAAYSISHAGTTNYVYDELDRLKEVDFPDGRSVIYDYDEIGNLIGKSMGLSPCPAGYSLNPADNLCEKTPECAQGTFDPSDNLCHSGSLTSYLSQCPIGSYASESSRCEATATATYTGNFTVPVYNDGTNCSSQNICYLGSTGNNIFGYLSTTSFTGAIAVYNVSGNLKPTGSESTRLGYMNPTSFYGSKAVHSIGGNFVYAPGLAVAGYIAPTSGGGPVSYSCSTGTLSGSICWAMPTCPSGGVLQGASCVTDTRSQSNPSCTGGTLDPATHKCHVTPARYISINGMAANSNTTAVMLTLSCTGDTGSCGQMRFSSDNINWSAPEPYAVSKCWALTGGDGAKYVYVKFTDSSGNWFPAVNSSIILDTAPPTTTASPVGAFYTSTQTVTLTCTDGGTGCYKIYYTTDGSMPTTASAVYTAPLTVAAYITLKYYAVDRAGYNEATKSQEYNICSGSHIRIAGKGDYLTIQDAYNAAESGDIIQAQALAFAGNLTANKDISVTLDGGYTCDFSSNLFTTALQGVLTTSSGTLTISNLVLQP